MAKNLDVFKIDAEWWDKMPFEEVAIKSEDNLKLVGHFLACENSSDKLAILVHGYGGVYKEMYNYAKMFLKRNYDILAIELRAHVNSEGDMIGMGWLERLDLLKWIDFMVERNKNYKIALFGTSMGASTVCMALGEKLPTNVKLAISDCAFDNAWRELSYVYTYHTHIPAKFLMSIFNNYLKRTKHFDLKMVDAVTQLKKAKLPILFIHGSKDTFVPTEMVYRLAEAVPKSQRDLYVVEGAEHIMSYPTDPKAYEKKVDNFLKKHNML